jgi:Putative MetA-pathway of phenol degradation
MGRISKLSVHSAMVVLACLACTVSAAGQWIGKQTGCYADSIAANPNRPTISNPARLTQYGVLEVEYGWDHVWPQAAVDQISAGGLLKFGLLCDVELRWQTTSFVSQRDPSGTHTTFGDNWLGSQVRLYRQTARVPALAFGYAIKVPSASTEAGLGTGHVDHSFTLLASKDIAHFSVDFDLSEFLIGRQNQSGYDQNQQLSLAFSHSIYRELGFTGEFYGSTRLNADTPGYTSSLWALTYRVVPRLVIDGGFEAGLTSGGPHRHAFFGATYSIANLYRAWRPK